MGAPSGPWQPVHLFPAQQYRRLWQHFLLSALRRRLRGNRSAVRLIGRLYRAYPTGFIVNVMSHYVNGRQAAAYCCRYTGRPPLSERRLGYDGKWVTLAYRDYRDGQEKTLTLPAVTFLLRLLQHVWPRYQRDVHYYGLYQPPRRRQHAQAVAKASRYGDQVLPAPLLSRAERLLKALSGQELKCPECGGCLRIERVQFPKRRSHAKKSRQRTRPPPSEGQLALPV